MSAPGLTSSIRKEGFQSLQLNAGMFLANFDLSSLLDTLDLRQAIQAEIDSGDKLLGMTTGGGVFTLKREPRNPDVDGRRCRFKGDEFIDSLDAMITSTLIEIVPENWQRVFGTAFQNDEDPDDGHDVYSIGTAIVSTSYVNRLTWVGDLADGRLVAIDLPNVLNLADIKFTFKDKAEGQLPFEMHAHQSAVNVYDRAPLEIVFFNGVFPSFWHTNSDNPAAPLYVSPGQAVKGRYEQFRIEYELTQVASESDPNLMPIKPIENCSLNVEYPAQPSLHWHIDFPSTVHYYGEGTNRVYCQEAATNFDLANGTREIKWLLIQSYNGQPLPAHWVCDRDLEEDGTPPIGSQVAVQLDPPIVEPIGDDSESYPMPTPSDTYRVAYLASGNSSYGAIEIKFQENR